MNFEKTFLGLLLMLLALFEEEELSWDEGRGSCCCLKGAGEILALLGAIVLLVEEYGTPWLLVQFDPAPVFKLEAEEDSPNGCTDPEAADFTKETPLFNAGNKLRQFFTFFHSFTFATSREGV